MFTQKTSGLFRPAAFTCSGIAALGVLVCASSSVIAESESANAPETASPVVSQASIDLEEAIRLPTEASSKGWLGRLPSKRAQSKQGNSPRKPKFDELKKPNRKITSLIPPAAPLTDPDDRMVAAVAVKTPAVPHPVVQVKPQAVPAIIASITKQTSSADAAIRNPTRLAVLPIDEAAVTEPEIATTSDSEEGADEETSNADDDEEDDEAANADESPLSLSELGLSRSLTSVSLSSSVQNTALDGSELRVPDDQAAAMFAEFGVFHDMPTIDSDSTMPHWQYVLCHNPLYFEDPNMERGGRGYGCFTELVSIARFFGRVPIVPYMMGSNPPCSCIPSLGDCPACYKYGLHAYVPPLNVSGVAAQAVATVGLIYMVP